MLRHRGDLSLRWRLQGHVLDWSERAVQKLAGDKNRETRDDVGIATPQAPRFRAEPKQPFEPVPLHPSWCLTLRPGQKVERRPDPDHDRSIDSPEVALHPHF